MATRSSRRLRAGDLCWEGPVIESARPSAEPDESRLFWSSRDFLDSIHAPPRESYAFRPRHQQVNEGADHGGGAGRSGFPVFLVACRCSGPTTPGSLGDTWIMRCCQVLLGRGLLLAPLWAALSCRLRDSLRRQVGLPITGSIVPRRLCMIVGILHFVMKIGHVGGRSGGRASRKKERADEMETLYDFNDVRPLAAEVGVLLLDAVSDMELDEPKVVVNEGRPGGR